MIFIEPFTLEEFDPAKVLLFRSLALLLLAVLLIHELEAGEGLSRMVSRASRRVRRTPFAGVIAALVLIYLVSTLFSVSPRISFWGEHTHRQGTYTFLTYVILFLVVLRALRRQAQLERLVTVLLAVSFPVSVYGILQHFGVTLLGFSGVGFAIPNRVISTIGNPIFVAAYLVMVVPLTLRQIVRHVQRWSGGRSPEAALGAGLYAALLGLQFLCMLYTDSRGPLLGVAVGTFFMLFLAALVYGRRRWAGGALAVAGLAFLFLVALNVPAIPLGGLRQLPYLERFSQMTQAGGSGSLRVLYWESVLDAVSASPRRLLLGYGPEVMSQAVDPFMSPQIVPLYGERSIQRAHNMVLDMLFATGIVGAVAYLLLFGLIFYRACRWLGLAATARDRWLLAGLLVAGAGLGLVGAVAAQGDLALAGIGVPAGMLAGLVLYLVIRGLQGAATALPADMSNGLLLIALLSAVVGHFVEGFTGIGVVSTRTYFWLYLALMILLGERRLGEAAPAPVERASTRRAGRRDSRRNTEERGASADVGSLAALSLVVSAALACLVFAFVHGFATPATRKWALGLIAVTWFFSGLLILLERRRAGSGARGLDQEVMVYVVATLAWITPFALYYSARVDTYEAFDESLVVFILWLFLTMLAAAAALVWKPALSQRDRKHGARQAARLQRSSSEGWLARGKAGLYALLLAAVLMLIWITNLKPLRADVYGKIGESAMNSGMSQLAVDSLQRAVQLNRAQPELYYLLGDAYLDQAQSSADAVTRDSWLAQAQQSLERGWALAPGDSDYPQKLGALYTTWAQRSSRVQDQKARLEQSLRYYLAAAGLRPQSPSTQQSLAERYFALGFQDEALAAFQRVIDLGDRDFLAAAYAGMGDVYVAQKRFGEAAVAYQQAMQVGAGSQEALQVRRNLVDGNPKRVDYRERLALVYAGAGRRDEALGELQAASGAANAAERAEIEQLMRLLDTIPSK